MSEERKKENATVANRSISVKLKNKNMTIFREKEILYDGPYSSEILRSILEDTSITFSPESTNSIVEILDEIGTSNNERTGYWGCLGYSFLILAIVILICYGIGLGLF